MFEYTQYNIAPWGYELALYFFLIGTAAMVFVTAAAPNVFGKVAAPFQAFQMTGMIVTLLMLLVCAALLIVDLAQPSRFLYPILYFHWTSPLSWGALFLPLFGLSIIGFVYGVKTGKAEVAKWSGILGSLLALSMPLYTGLDLMVHQARELWSNPTIPVLFVILSITSGAALVAILLMATKRLVPDATRLIRIVLYFSVGVTFWLFLGVVVTLLYGSEEQQQAWAIINDQFALRFWLLTFIVGILAPLALLIPPRFAQNGSLVTAAAVAGAIGAFTFREVLLYAGQLTQLYY